jgi:hydrogenase expression/formation protein HypD
MKYISEFHDPATARALADRIAAEVRPDRRYAFMEFCGGHTHAIFRHGLLDLLPPAIRMIHGPGCPVCVLPVGRVDAAIRLVRKRGHSDSLTGDVTLATYGDVMRVPGSDGRSLFRARADGADVRMVYSVDDALALARKLPERRVVFLAIGFETTTPPTAAAVIRARAEGLANFLVNVNHVLTPPALEAILGGSSATQRAALDGFIGPAHVSTVIGSRPYEPVAKRYGKPFVIAGFEPLDVLSAILMLVKQVNEGRAEVENQYTRAVRVEGNLRAQAIVAEVFETRESFGWRGLGRIPGSALRLREAFAAFDAERVFPADEIEAPDHPGCQCGEVIQGLIAPTECALFASACTPDTPVGACMVSSEGACAAHYTYGRFRDRDASDVPHPHEKRWGTAALGCASRDLNTSEGCAPFTPEWGSSGAKS